MTKGITFNGIHSSQIDGVTGVLEYGFPLIPDMENRTAKITGMNGEIDGGRTLSPRVFTIVFLIDGDTIEDYFQKTFAIEQWLNVNEAKPFIFDVLPDRQLMARPTGAVEPDRVAGYSKASVEFTAFDPDFVAIQENTIQIVQGQTYSYAGSKPTKPYFSITVNEAASFFRLTHVETGKFILINQPVNVGDWIEINLETRKIMLRESDARAYTDIKSRFFEIDGDFTFTTNTTSPTIELSYRERW